MSEINAIATNNYLLATQQEVSHDNTLSGNGTVDSPLGVVPGYNETVLWDNPNGSQLPITVSELLSNFEYIRIEWCPYTEASNWTEPLDVITTKVKNNLIHLVGWGLANDHMAQVETNLLIDCSTVNLSTSNSGTITSLGNGTSTSNLTGYKIYKIVGINRKA